MREEQKVSEDWCREASGLGPGLGFACPPRAWVGFSLVSAHSPKTGALG